MTEPAGGIHATAVAIGGEAVLLTGRSGSGKSDLALRLMDRGAELVCDDQVMIAVEDDRLHAFAAPNIAGKIEVRGLGIVERPFRAKAPVALVVVLDEPAERLPLDAQLTRVGDVDLPLLRLNAFEASAPIKVELALDRALEEWK